MKKHLFRRIFALYFLVLLLSIIFIEFYVTNIVRSAYINELQNSLLVQTRLLSETVSFDAKTNLDAFCRLNKEKTGSRITVVDNNGKVLGDSDDMSARMGNHAGRPEIQQANISETGSSIRYSDTIHHDLLYVARKISGNNKPAGFIRLALPLTEVNKTINGLRVKINLAVILLFLFSGIILAWQMERIRKYVIQISEYAGALSHGLFRKRLYLEGAGEFTEMAGSLNDMANELESAIRERDEDTNRLSVILKSIPDALLLINMKDIIELSNNEAKKLFGMTKPEGRPYIEVVRSPELLSLVDTVKKDRVSGSADFSLDFPEKIYLAVNVSPLSYKAGELAGVVAIFHDTTRMRRLEQMRKDFVANVSHEIRTPVTAIKGFAETLLDGALNDRENAEKFLSTICYHSDRLNRLVEDLLTLSSIELGVIKISNTPLNIAEIIDNITGTMIVEASKKNLPIRKSFHPDAGMINADRDRLEQILLNLLDNAIKFTVSGEVEVGTARQGERNYFFVRDTGSGIPRKYLSRVGERFFRVDPSRSRELGGTGLGLAIVKHIVLAQRWEMNVESEVGKGTVVKIFY